MQRISFSDIIRSEGNWSLRGVKLFDHVVGAVLSCIVPGQKQHERAPSKVKNMLIIRPGGIGDAVFLLPILKILKARSIAVDILCEPRNAEVFRSQGYPVFMYGDFKELRMVLGRPYDVVVDTEQWHYLSALVAYFTRTSYRIGFATRPFRAKLFNKRIDYADNGYELDNFTALFNGFLPMAEKPVDINHCFNVPDAAVFYAQQQLPENSVTLFLGGSIKLRRFSLPQLRVLIGDVLAEGHIVALLGGKDAEEMAAAVVGLSTRDKIHNFVARISLLESAALIKRSQKFIGPDSGLMHIACAVGTPVVAIFGPGNVFKWGPHGSQHKVISKYVPCAPCTRFGYTVTTCNKSYICVKDIELK